MKNKAFKSFLSIIMIVSVLTFSNASVTGTMLEQDRQATIDEYVKRLTFLLNEIVGYINNTGDATPTRAELQTFNSIIVNAKFTTLLNEPCDVSGSYCGESGGITIELADGKISLKNVLTGVNDDIKRLFNTSLFLEPNQKISSDYSTFYINIPQETQTILDIIEDINSDPDKILVSNISDLPNPGEEGKQYFVPNGNGGLDVYGWDPNTGEYIKLGTVGGENATKTTSDGCTGNLFFTQESNFNEDTTPGTRGLCAKVEIDDVIKFYTHNGDKWVEHNMDGGSSAGGLYNGTGTVLLMATSLFDKSGGSVVSSSAPNGEFGGSLDFTKKDDYETGGYWVVPSNSFVVTKDISALSTLSDLFASGTTAWIANKTGGIDKLIKGNVAVSGETNVWIYQADTLEDIFEFNDASQSGNDGVYAYVVSQNKYYYLSNSIWTSTDGIHQVSNHVNGRDIFSDLATGVTYFINVSDCSIGTCNGTDGTYAGELTDNMYPFYFAPSALNVKNLLTDAIPVSSVANAYSSNGAAHLIQNTSGNVPAGSVILKYPSLVNGSVCYTYDGNFVTQAAVVVQDHLGNNLLDRTCTGVNMASFNGTGVNQKINTTSLNQFVSVVPSSLVGYKVYLSGEGITSALEYCRDSGYTTYSSGQKVWSSDCANESSTAYAITDGSREDLSAPSNSTRINLTLNTGTETNYTGTPANNYLDGGIAYVNNPSAKQWYYSVTGTVTNRLLDAKPVASTWGAEDFDDKAQSAWGFSLTDIYIDSNNVIGTITSKGYSKYCYETNVLNSNTTTSKNWYSSGATYLSNWAITNPCAYNISGDTVRCLVYVNGVNIFTFGQLFSCSNPISEIPNSSVTQSGGYSCRGFYSTKANATASCNTAGSDVWYK